MALVYNGKELYTPTAKQLEFHSCPARYTLLAGGIGGAKTTALVMEAYQHCIEYPGTQIYLGRKRLVNFRISTLKTWENLFPPELYANNQQKQEITIHTAKRPSIIYYGGFDTTEQVNKFLGTEYSFIGVDQAEELTGEEYGKITTRLRFKIKTTQGDIIPHYRVVLTANPRKCFLRSIFVDNPDTDHVMITSNASDNPNLPPGYIEHAEKDLMHLPLAIRQALIYGSWDVDDSEFVVIPYSTALAASKREWGLAYTDKRIVSIDVARGGADLTVLYGWEGTKIIKEEIYGKKDLDVTAARAVNMLKQVQANTIIWDADGIGGGLLSNLKPLVPENTALIEYHGSGESTDNRYYNQRAEAYFEAGELFKSDLMSIPADMQLVGQLSVAKFEYRLGKLIIQDKDEMKLELNGKSPDKSDSCIIGIYGLKRAPSTSVRRPIQKGSYAEAVREHDDYLAEQEKEEAIGNHNIDKW